MSNLAVSRRYAQALHAEALSSSAIEATDRDVALVRQALADSSELSRFFGSPVISREKKKSVVAALLKERVGPVLLRLIDLLVDKGREDHLLSVLASYAALRDEELGVTDVSVRSARSVSDEERTAISMALKNRIGKDVRLAVTVDPSLLGGMVIQVGDTVYDGSVANKLASLRERMLESSILN